MTSTLITDYVGRGLRSALPASPNIGSGAGAFYFATDTSELFAWKSASWVLLALLSGPAYPVLAPAAVTGSAGATLTAAELLGGEITRSGPTGAVTDTSDTAVNLVAGIPDAAVDASFRCRYVNTTAQTITIAGGTGVTIAGSTTVGGGTSAEILGVVTAIGGSPAVTLYVAAAVTPPSPSSATPAANGVGAAGSSSAYARGDHVHPIFPIRGWIAGLALANDGGAPNTKIDIAAGQATDSTAAFMMVSASALSVDFTTTGAGALDAGSIAASTWYHVFLIGKGDGTVAGLASISLASPSLPSGYSYFRRIGSVKTDGSSHILAFTQVNEDFYWTAEVADYATNISSTSATLIPLSVPPGVNVEAFFRCFNVSGGGYILVSSPNEPDLAPSAFGSLSAPGYDLYPANGNSATRFLIMTDTSRQVRVRSTAASTGLDLYTIGWRDSRGRYL